MSLINVPGAASRFLEKKVGRFTLCAGLAAGMVAALSLGTANVASAATVPAVHQPAKGGGFGWGGPRSRRGHGFGGGAIGTVASLPLSTTAPTSFTITTGSSSSPATVTVDVSTRTTFKDPGVSSPGLANLAVGDQVQVVGTQAGTGTVDATAVSIPSARDLGTVASVPLSTTAPTSFTITTGSSSSPTTVTVDVSTTTTFKDPGVSSPGLANLAVGDKVQVVGTQAGTGTVDATSVGLGSSAGGPWGGGGFGGGFGGGGRHHHGGR